MGFVQGTVTVRRANHLGRPLDLNREEVWENLQKHAAQPWDAIGDALSAGWVTSRHLLDTQITPETTLDGDYLFLDMRLTARKVPPALLRAHCLMEETARRTVEGRDFLKREEKKQIREEVEQRLIRSVPPTLRGFPLVYSALEKCWWAAISGDATADLFMMLVHQTFDSTLEWMGPEEIALHLLGADRVRSMKPFTFSLRETQGAENDDPVADLGPDFLTWLWFRTETEGPALSLKELGEVEVLIEDDLTLEGERGVTRSSVLRRGLPTKSAEAKAALSVGKKLCRCRWSISQSDEVWTGQFDAREFITRSLKCPTGIAYQEGGAVESRMVLVERYWRLVEGLYGLFLSERTADWNGIVAGMKEWIQQKTGG